MISNEITVVLVYVIIQMEFLVFVACMKKCLLRRSIHWFVVSGQLICKGVMREWIFSSYSWNSICKFISSQKYISTLLALFVRYICKSICKCYYLIFVYSAYLGTFCTFRLFGIFIRLRNNWVFGYCTRLWGFKFLTAQQSSA